MSIRTLIILVISLFTSAILYAYAQQAGFEYTDLVAWTSNDPRDPVVLENGTGTRMWVQINVQGGGSSTAPGIAIKNCGRTARVGAGSSAICYTNDPASPITFSSESTTTPATGTYRIRISPY